MMMNIFRVSNSLDPDQPQCFGRPDLGPNSKGYQHKMKLPLGWRNISLCMDSHIVGLKDLILVYTFIYSYTVRL